MDRLDPPPPPAPPGDLHRRTWELELLISGAVLLVLLQLPGPVDRWYHRIQPALAGATRLSVFFLYYYVKLSLYTLIGGLVLHLALRAYWVGLIGLDSVFPGGVRWDGVRMGPQQLALARERAPSLPSMIHTSGALASIVFGAAFALVWVFVVSLGMIAAAGGIAALISTLLLDGRHLERTFWIVLLLLFSPLVGAMSLDRTLGDRMAADSGGARAVRAILRFGYAAGLQRFYAPIGNLLYSNLGRGAYLSALYTAMVVCAGLFIVKDVLLAGGALRLGGGGFVPDRGGALAIEDTHYDERRADPWSDPRAPSIPAEVVEGSWLRVFVPYHPERDADAVAATCPSAERLAPAGIRLLGRRDHPPDPARVREALACVGALWRVSLDGRAVAAPEWRFATRTGTRLPGIVAYLDVEGLGRGAHRLTIERTGPAGEDESEDAPPLRYDIAFWR